MKTRTPGGRSFGPPGAVLHARDVAISQPDMTLIASAANGKDGTRFPTALATFAARAVHSGRRVTGMDKARDVLSPRAQQLYGFAAGALPRAEPLAALVGDRAGAIEAYSHYLALRHNPEPAVKPEVDSVRAELARLVGERR